LLTVFMLVASCAKEADEHQDEHGAEPHKEEGEEGHKEGEALALSAASQQSIGLKLAAVERRSIGGNTLLPARVELQSGRTAHISAPVAGRFTRVAVTQGQRVKAGDLLALVRAADTAMLGARASQLRAELVFANQQVERQEKLGAAGVGAERQLEEARSTTRRLQAELAGLTRQLQIVGARGAGDILMLTSPIDGIIVNQHALLGEAAGPDHVSFVVSDPSEVWIVGQAPERLIPQVGEGVAVVTRLHAWPSDSWAGKLDYVAPALDGEAHTLPVRLSVPNPSDKLKAGMFGTMEILGQDERPLTIPASAVLLVDGAHTVFVPDEGHDEHKGHEHAPPAPSPMQPAGPELVAPEPAETSERFKPVRVEIGRRDGEFVEVKQGLVEGQRVVTQGAFTLKSMLKSDELGEGHAH
jgi:membrane fusion protein, heavy metal efflux system